MALVDVVTEQEPPLQEDAFWKAAENGAGGVQSLGADYTLPHTRLSAAHPDRPPKLHAQVSMQRKDNVSFHYHWHSVTFSMYSHLYRHSCS